MSFAKKHNAGTGKLFTFNPPAHFVYKTLKDLATENPLDTVYQVNAFYINTKGRYGDSPVIATNNELVNAPQHLLNIVQDVFKDAESQSLINNGYVGFKIYTYQNDFGTNYALEWVDIDKK